MQRCPPIPQQRAACSVTRRDSVQPPPLPPKFVCISGSQGFASIVASCSLAVHYSLLVLLARPAMAPAGENGTSDQHQEAPQDVKNGPAAVQQQQEAPKPVRRYRRAELDEEEERQKQLLLEDGEDE